MSKKKNYEGFDLQRKRKISTTFPIDKVKDKY